MAEMFGQLAEQTQEIIMNNVIHTDENESDWKLSSFFPSGIHLIILIISFKGAISDFLQSPHCVVNHLQHVCSSGPGAIVCKSRATHRALITCNMSCYMPRGTKG